MLQGIISYCVREQPRILLENISLMGVLEDIDLIKVLEFINLAIY